MNCVSNIIYLSLSNIHHHLTTKPHSLYEKALPFWNQITKIKYEERKPYLNRSYSTKALQSNLAKKKKSSPLTHTMTYQNPPKILTNHSQYECSSNPSQPIDSAATNSSNEANNNTLHEEIDETSISQSQDLNQLQKQNAHEHITPGAAGANATRNGNGISRLFAKIGNSSRTCFQVFWDRYGIEMQGVWAISLVIILVIALLVAFVKWGWEWWSEGQSWGGKKADKCNISCEWICES